MEFREGPDLFGLLAQLVQQLADGDQSRHDKSDPVKNFSFDSLNAEIGWFAQLGFWSRLVLDLRRRCCSAVFLKEEQHTKEETKPLPLGKGWS